MPGTWTVKDYTPTAEDWENTSWILDIGAAKYMSLGTVIEIDADLFLTIRVPTEPGSVTHTSKDPVAVSEAGLINGNFVGLDENGKKKPMVAAISMIVLEDPEDPEVKEERHITVLSMIGDPDNVGVMGGSSGG